MGLKPTPQQVKLITYLIRCLLYTSITFPMGFYNQYKIYSGLSKLSIMVQLVHVFSSLGFAVSVLTPQLSHAQKQPEATCEWMDVTVLVPLYLQKQMVDPPTWPTAILCPPLMYANPGTHFHFISHDQVSASDPALVPQCEPHRPGAGCFPSAKLAGAFCGQAAGCLLYHSNWDCST